MIKIDYKTIINKFKRIKVKNHKSMSSDQMKLNWNLIAINLNQLKYKHCYMWQVCTCTHTQAHRYSYILFSNEKPKTKA